MRVVEYLVDYFVGLKATARSALAPTDDFAWMPADWQSDPAIGGFRILHPRPLQRTTARLFAFTRRLPGLRAHTIGLLSVVFVGGLAISVLAGPANCRCGHPEWVANVAEPPSHARLVARLAYAKASVIDTGTVLSAKPVRLASLEVDSDATELPTLTTAALVETYDRIEASSVTAIEPLRNVKEWESPQHIGILPANIEELSDAKPIRLAATDASESEALTTPPIAISKADTTPDSIRLAATDPSESEVLPAPPITAISKPETPEITPDIPEAKPAIEVPEAREQDVSKPKRTRSFRAHRSKRKAVKTRSAKKVARAPRWAQQMFATPWQNKAFSYLQ